MLAVLGGLERLYQSDARIDRSIDAAGAFFGGVLQAEIDRIDLQLLGQLVDDLFAGEGGLRRAGCAVRLRMWLIVDHVVGLDPRVRQFVATEDAHGAWANHAAGKTAAVVRHPSRASDERAILFRAQ